MTRVRKLPAIALVAVAVLFSVVPSQTQAACCGRGRVFQRVKHRIAARRGESNQVESRCVGDACQVPAATAATAVLPPPPR